MPSINMLLPRDTIIATRPHAIGELVTVSLMMQNLGIKQPVWYNSGIGYMTPDMVKNGNIEGF